MKYTTIEDKLTRLGYSQLWLDSGILTNEDLELQLTELESGFDDNTEHYRYRTFTNYFNHQVSFDDKVLKQILQLLQNDNDKAMAGAATIVLLKKSTLTDDQFETVATFLQTFGKWTIKQLDKARQHREKL